MPLLRAETLRRLAEEVYATQEPRVLLVDEPIAGMTQQETERTAELLNSLAGAHTVVVVEHDMEFVRNFADFVTATSYRDWRFVYTVRGPQGETN